MPLPYALDPPTDALGLILLETDAVLETEIRALVPPGATLLHARIPSQPEVTPSALATMAAELPRAAASFPAAARLTVVGYACTSGATVIGRDEVARLVRVARPGAEVTDPISAVIAAMRALKVGRIGMLTPYEPMVSASMRALLEGEGIETAGFGSFEQRDDATVARISEASTLKAMLEIGAAPGVEAVFASCTNLRSFGVIEEAERRLGKPVVTSNSALAWRMFALAGLEARGPGRLFLT